MQSFLPEVIIVKSAKDSDPKTAPNLNKLCNWLILWDTMKMLSDGKSGLDYWRIFYSALFHGKNVGNILSTDYILLFAVYC
jgi:hypothetical protein